MYLPIEQNDSGGALYDQYEYHFFSEKYLFLCRSGVTYGEVINVNTKNGNAVLLSEEDYRNMMETLHLSVIPGMVESIQKAAEEPLDTCVPYDPSEPW